MRGNWVDVWSRFDGRKRANRGDAVAVNDGSNEADMFAAAGVAAE
jgi:hypothetical protein